MKLNVIKKYLYLVGKKPLCNKIPERAPHIGDFCFLLCWRCTGIVIGAIISSILFFYIFNFSEKMIFITFPLLLPILFDGISQYYFNRKSNNAMRFVTGILFGTALGSLMLLI